MGLYRRIPRELRANRLRYLALFFLVALGMYVVVGLVGAADTIIRAVDHSAVQNRREDGQFTVFAPLSGAQLLALEQAGATVEAMPYLDYAGEGGSVLRVFQTRQHIDLTQADTGTLPNVGEVLLEKLYANAHGLAAGDVLSIGGTALTVSGTGTSPDYDAPLQNLTDVAQDSHRFGTVFVDPADYLALRASGQSLQSETCLYAYRLGGGLTHGALKQMLRGFTIDRAAITDTYFLELLDELDEPKNELLDGVEKLVDGGASLNGALAALGVAGDDLLAAFQEAGLPPQLLQPLAEYLAVVNAAERGGAQLQSGLDELQRQAEDLAGEVFGYDIENLTSFVEAKDNPRVAASAADVVINKNGGIMAGIIALVLFAYVISVFTVHSIDSDSEVIGTLYALGAPRGALVRHYLALPVLVAGLGGMAGTALGFSPLGVAYQMRDTAGYFSFPTPAAYTPLYLLIYGLAMPPLVAALVNFLVVRSRLARPRLALLRKEHAK